MVFNSLSEIKNILSLRRRPVGIQRFGNSDSYYRAAAADIPSLTGLKISHRDVISVEKTAKLTLKSRRDGILKIFVYNFTQRVST